ncbi:histidine kinase dimerization/phosphoacceptor domain -containing protein [Pseudochelatococcus sp. G4_1912]|uniref:histidine kinase dimerization/phosphoacceptor domain -containing protein n=1 Tax=Pseudochelatococcus sp. G4_1912 TaxID=3114288 RepID=UPI0039C6735D
MDEALIVDKRQRPARSVILHSAAQEAVDSEPETNSRGLRSQIIIALGMVLIPAALAACFWAFVQNQRLYDIKISTAERAADRVAGEISSLLRDNTITAATQFSPNDKTISDPSHCKNQMTNFLRERREYSFSALFVNQAMVCFADTTGLFNNDEAAIAEIAKIRDQLRKQQSYGINPAVVRSEDGHHLLLGTKVISNEAAAKPSEVFLVSALRTSVLSYNLIASRLGIDRGTAVITAQGDVIVQSTSSSLTDNWFPAHATAITDALSREIPITSLATLSQSGEPFHYFIAPTVNPDLFVLTGYPDASLFALERSILWSSLLPPLLMLIVAGIGALWATERLVVRWIRYLQRVTRLYGSGRLSVRAVHIRDAPREIAELGDAFNDMATNIAEQTYQRERAAQEKETVLRELHHRVKNNFQVIVSLLSLHKRAEETSHSNKVEAQTDINGLRFIEDHVQAMSVAYRVGYSSGDLGEAPLAELMHDVIDSLIRTSHVSENDVLEVPPAAGYFVDLDRAIGIALYIAAVLPAYLDTIRRAPPNMLRPKVLVSAKVTAAAGEDNSEAQTKTPIGYLQLTFATLPLQSVTPSALQERLARAYVRQLNAKTVLSEETGENTIIIPLENTTGAFFRL